MPPCYAVCCKTTAAFCFSDVRISTSRSYTCEWDCCRTSHITSYHLSFPFFYPIYSGFFLCFFFSSVRCFFFFCFFRCYSPLAVIFFPRTFTFALLFARCRWYVCCVCVFLFVLLVISSQNIDTLVCSSLDDCNHFNALASMSMSSSSSRVGQSFYGASQSQTFFTRFQAIAKHDCKISKTAILCVEKEMNDDERRNSSSSNKKKSETKKNTNND